jgi:propionyl-CoA carboxylase alpha chain
LSIDVVAGMKVEAGQQVACVEAMKMVNIIRAHKAGVIKKVSPKCIAGAHLRVDQLIVEFE